MVCLPCFVIPVLLYVFHKFIQPFILKFWNPWQVKDKDGNVVKTEEPKLFQCKDGVCSFAFNRKKIEDSQSPGKDADSTAEISDEIEKKHK